jgi:hypothetical protein
MELPTTYDNEKRVTPIGGKCPDGYTYNNNMCKGIDGKSKEICYKTDTTSIKGMKFRCEIPGTIPSYNGMCQDGSEWSPPNECIYDEEMLPEFNGIVDYIYISPVKKFMALSFYRPFTRDIYEESVKILKSILSDIFTLICDNPITDQNLNEKLFALPLYIKRQSPDLIYYDDYLISDFITSFIIIELLGVGIIYNYKDDTFNINDNFISILPNKKDFENMTDYINKNKTINYSDLKNYAFSTFQNEDYDYLNQMYISGLSSGPGSETRTEADILTFMDNLVTNICLTPFPTAPAQPTTTTPTPAKRTVARVVTESYEYIGII